MCRGMTQKQVQPGLASGSAQARPDDRVRDIREIIGVRTRVSLRSPLLLVKPDV
jgi:hypothetical protein